MRTLRSSRDAEVRKSREVFHLCTPAPLLPCILFGRTLSIKSGSLVLEGSAEALVNALQVGEGAPVFGAVAIKPVANRPGVFRAVNREGLGLIEYKGNGRFYLSKFNRTLDTDGVQYVRFRRGALLGEAQVLRTLSSLGLAFVIDVGFESYEFVTGTGQWGNPYLTERDKKAQAILVIGSDLLLAGGLAFYGIAPEFAIPAQFIWVFIADPIFANAPFSSQFYDEERNLQPLN